MADLGGEFSFFQGIHERIDVRIDISMTQQVLVTSLRQDHQTNENHYICPTIVPMATKLGRMLTYLVGLLPIKSHDPLITWYCDIT